METVPPKTLDRAAAWGCLVSNLAVLPGLGSVVAGRRCGYVQATLALVGMSLSVVWMVFLLMQWHRTGEYPFDGGPHVTMGLSGFGMFLVGWIWALTTSLALMREAKQSEGGAS